MKDATKYANEHREEGKRRGAGSDPQVAARPQIVELSTAERNAWKKAMVKIHKQMEGTVGRDLLQSIYKETNFNPEAL